MWMPISGRVAMIESTINKPPSSSEKSVEPPEWDVETRSATRLSRVDTVPRRIQSSDFLCQQIARKLSVILVRVKSFSISFPRDSLSRLKPLNLLNVWHGYKLYTILSSIELLILIMSDKTCAASTPYHFLPCVASEKASQPEHGSTGYEIHGYQCE